MINGIPDAYPDGTRFVHDGHAYIITAHAPNSDAWKYEAHRADLSGPVIHVPHHEIRPVTPERAAGLAPSARSLLSQAGLSVDRYAYEHARIVEDELTVVEQTPELNLIQAVALWAHGGLSSADLKATYLMFTEGQTA